MVLSAGADGNTRFQILSVRFRAARAEGVGQSHFVKECATGGARDIQPSFLDGGGIRGDGRRSGELLRKRDRLSLQGGLRCSTQIDMWIKDDQLGTFDQAAIDTTRSRYLSLAKRAARLCISFRLIWRRLLLRGRPIYSSSLRHCV